VRNKPEWEDGGVVAGAQLLAMPELEAKIDQVPKDKTVYVHCRSGIRSYFAVCLLKKHGVDAIDVQGGMNAMITAGVNRKVPTF